MSGRFAAEFMDGQSAAVRPIVLTLEPAGVHLADAMTGASLGSWPLQGLTVDELHGALVHLQHRNYPGALITSRDPALPSALASVAIRPVSLPRGRALAQWAAIYAGGLALMLVAAYLAVPALSRALARRVPFAVEERIGLPIGERLDAALCTSPAATAALDALTDTLLRDREPSLHGPGPRTVGILNWQVVNAFTFPGGRVVLTRGLLEAAKGPDEIAGVLAHEFEHVRQRHIMAHIIRSSILSLGWAVTVGDFSGLFVVDPSTMFTLATQSFSRTDELAADAGALARLDAAGIGRGGFAAFFQRIRAQADVVPAWLTSHPATEERIAAIGNGPPAATNPALDASQWRALKDVCAGRAPIENPLRSLF